MTKFKTLTIILLLLLVNLKGNTQTLVKDFYQGQGDAVKSWGTKFLQIKDQIYISVSSSETTVDLNVIKNEEAHFVTNLCKNCSSSYGTFAEYNNKLIFSNYNDDGTTSVMITEGSPETTKLLAKFNSSVDNIKVGKNNLVYILTYSNIYVSNGTEIGTKKLNTTSFEIASHTPNNDDVIMAQYNNGVAFLVNDSGDAQLMYADTSVQSLATFNVGSSFTDIFGLNNLEDGLVFAVEDEGIYHYSPAKGLVKTNIEEPLRLFGFNGNVVYYKYGQGLSLLHDNPIKSTFLINNYGSVNQNASVSRAIIGDNMLIHIDDYNSFDDLIINIDKNAKTAVNLGEVESYPSNFVQYNDNIFFAAGTSNGFSPYFYHLKNDFTSLDKFHSFNFDSNNGPSIIPIGVQNKSVFYISNSDPSIGRELYKISADVNTTVENTSTNKQPKIVLSNKAITVVSNEISKDYEVSIYNLNGVLLGKRTMNTTNEWTTNYNSTMVLIQILDKENGKYFTSLKYIN